jgi:hypothetical protein
MKAAYRKLAMALGAFAALAPVCARAGISGVWEGTIGNSKVMLCLPQYSSSGSYYYRRHLSLIRLEKTGEGEWNEFAGDRNTGHWQLKEAGDGTLAGMWNKPGSAGVPIRLARPAHGDAFCSGDAFNAPLENNEEAVRGTSSFAGRRHGTLLMSGATPDLGTHQAVQLLETSPAAQAINERLRVNFPIDRAGLYGCRRSMLDSLGYVDTQQPLQSMEQEIVFWNQRLFSVRIQSTANCGGAHPNEGKEQKTFDLATGRELGMKYWINGASEEGLPQALKRVVLARAQGNKGREASCTGSLEDQQSFQIYPSAKGLVFFTNFNFAQQACDEDIVVPFADIDKYLTPEAKAALAK